MQLSDIKKLAQMARLDMSDEELENMAHEFEPILAYVGQIQEISELSDTTEDYFLTNVMRDDVVTNSRGAYTEDIVKQMPDSQDGFLKVKQIL